MTLRFQWRGAIMLVAALGVVLGSTGRASAIAMYDASVSVSLVGGGVSSSGGIVVLEPTGDFAVSSDNSPGASSLAAVASFPNTLGLTATVTGSTGLPLPSFATSDATAFWEIVVANPDNTDILLTLDLNSFVSATTGIDDPLSESLALLIFASLTADNTLLWSSTIQGVDGQLTSSGFGSDPATFLLGPDDDVTFRLTVEAHGSVRAEAEAAAVPAPATLLLLGAALSGLAGWRLRLQR